VPYNNNELSINDPDSMRAMFYKDIKFADDKEYRMYFDLGDGEKIQSSSSDIKFSFYKKTLGRNPQDIEISNFESWKNSKDNNDNGAYGDDHYITINLSNIDFDITIIS
jgi:hypothetical protein